MITWSSVERDDLFGRTYCASLLGGFCAAFVPGMSVDDYTNEVRVEFDRWKFCAEQTLYKIALECPGYQQPIDCLRPIWAMMKTENNEVFYAGNTLKKLDLIGTLGIDNLFVVRNGTDRIACVVSLRSTGVHITRQRIGSELEAWRIMMKGIE